MTTSSSLPSYENFYVQLQIITLPILVISLILLFNKFLKKTTSLVPTLPPEPRGLPVVGNLLSLQPELHTHFASLSRTHGPIYTLKLGTKLCIVITSPTTAREVLKDQDITFANRDILAVSTAVDSGHDIVFAPYGPEWRMLRKVCVRHMLGPATLDAVYSLRRREIRNMIKKLYQNREFEIDVGKEVFLTVMNVVTSMLWGETVEERERAAVADEFRNVVAEVTAVLGSPNLSDFFPILAPFDLQGKGKKMRESSEKLGRVFDRVIDRRRKLDKLIGLNGGDNGCERGKEDFVKVLLQIMDEGDDKTPLTIKHVKALLQDMVVGGTDTTSNTVEFAMAELMNKPEVMTKAQEELGAIIGKNNVVEESDIYKLPYLNAITKEVLRLHPILPLMVPHCPSKSSIVSGYTIPKGARVFINVWAIHRDPLVWENPEEFIPERFLNGKWDYGGNDFCYIPFGSGRRICAGVAMAERMVMFLLGTLLHSFDWKLPEGENLEISEKFGIVLKKKVPLVAIPIPRLLDQVLYE